MDGYKLGMARKMRNGHPQSNLPHALARLRVKNECRFEGHLRSPLECRVANYSIISADTLTF